jgi:hypothetical protein
MKGYRFFAELPQGRTSKRGNAMFNPWTRANIKAYAENGGLSNVVAIFTETPPYRSGQEIVREGLVATFAHNNSDTSVGSAAESYLRKRTTSIDEKTARRLHPKLFARLDEAEDEPETAEIDPAVITEGDKVFDR